jgi:sterol desaturase/sphingolipid hydroxylase (fatty acid hydroxylase superfamily)
MEDLLTNNEGYIRFGAFAGFLILFSAAETLAPQRARRELRVRRWITNLGVSALSSAILRAILPGASVLAALWAQSNGVGVLNQLSLPDAAAIAAAYLALDLAVYAQHVASHYAPVLWRLHRVHHADLDVDATTGVRFHPAEIFLSQLWKMIVIVAMGAGPVAVIVFEIVLNATALFNHANWALPAKADILVRSVLVTPDMHRIHHSVEALERNSNFGFSLSLWDRVFGTYMDRPRPGAAAMRIGLPEFQDERPGSMIWALGNPFTDEGAR